MLVSRDHDSRPLGLEWVVTGWAETPLAYSKPSIKPPNLPHFLHFYTNTHSFSLSLKTLNNTTFSPKFLVQARI